MEGLVIRRASIDDLALQSLIVELDKEFWVRYPDTQQNFAPFNKLDSTARVVMAYRGTDAIACGCFRSMHDPEVVEIKRMYVKPTDRGHGIAKQILCWLEEWAIEEGFKQAILETGIKQPEAIALYERCGYQLIPNYPPYIGVDESICFRKMLSKA